MVAVLVSHRCFLFACCPWCSAFSCCFVDCCLANCLFLLSFSKPFNWRVKYGVVLVCLAWIMQVEANYVRYSDLRGKPYSVTYDKRSIIVDGKVNCGI